MHNTHCPDPPLSSAVSPFPSQVLAIRGRPLASAGSRGREPFPNSLVFSRNDVAGVLHSLLILPISRRSKRSDSGAPRSGFIVIPRFFRSMIRNTSPDPLLILALFLRALSRIFKHQRELFPFRDFSPLLILANSWNPFEDLNRRALRPWSRETGRNGGYVRLL